MTEATVQDRRRRGGVRDRRFRSISVVLAVLLLAMLVVFTSDLSFLARRTVSDIGLLAGGVLLAVSCVRRIGSSSGRRRRTWIALGAAGLAAAIGNGWVFVAHLQGTVEPAPVDYLFLLALLLALLALSFYPAVKRRGLDLARILLDGVVIGGALLSAISVTLFPQMLGAGAGLADLLPPLLDIMLATLAAMLVLRGDRNDRATLLLLATGGLFYAISDLLRVAFTAQGTFAYGGPVDIGWMIGYAALALAAILRSESAAVATDTPAAATPPLVSSSVTFGAFLVAAIVRVIFLPGHQTNLLTSLLWVAVLIAVTARQGLLILDNESLRHDLERRVEDRTSELEALTRTSQTMLNSVGDGIYGVDPQGVITFVNPSAAAMLGRTDAELIGQDAHQLFHAPQPDGTPFDYHTCYIAEAAQAGMITTSEEDTYLRAHGDQFAVEVTASPMMRDEKVDGAVVVFRDMTQRREVDKLKSEFVSVVSHELRTPLTSIRGSLGLLSAGALGPLTAPATRMVNIALDSSKRLTRLINDILDIERIESGTMPMQLEAHPALELIKTAVDQVQSIASEAGVELSIGSTEGQVWADGDRIVQTLVNLLGNAIKFSETQSVVDIEASAAAGMVTFRVHDQGRGIPSDKIDTVFLRFEQVDSSDAREKGGSGLGLAISRSIVERHGGEIWVQSEPGVGSVFSFTVPAPVGSRPGREPGTGPTVLVCDDDADFVEVICAVLNQHGYRALGVQNGQAAIELASEEQPAALLVDLMLQDGSGADLVAALRANPRTAGIPVVIVSGVGPAGNRDLAADTEDWLVKPIDEAQLMRALAVVIAQHSIDGEVLLVEDDEALASVVRAMLERRGLTVAHARSRTEALELVHGGRPGVLILDLELPDGTGAEVVSALRSDATLADLPVVVYSATEVSAEQRDRLRLGTTVFMTKGRTSPDQLEQRVVELVDMAIKSEHGRRDRADSMVG